MQNPLFTDGTIRLRAVEPEDLSLFYQWENDSALWRYGATVAPLSRFALREYIEGTLSGNIYTQRQLRLMVEKVGTNQAVGCADLYDFDPVHRRAAVGILIDPRFQNNGFGSATLELLSGYAFSFLALEQLYAYVSLSNVASHAIFRKAGFEQNGLLKRWIRVGDNFEDVALLQLLSRKGLVGAE